MADNDKPDSAEPAQAEAAVEEPPPQDEPQEAETAPAGAEAPDPTPRVSPLGAALVALNAELEQTRDRLLRTAAEFENYKKRSKRELGETRKRAEDKVVLEFLPVIDNLERALAHVEAGNEDDSGGLVGGVRMVHKQFLTTLERYDIRPFDSVGEPFDPELHEAVQQVAAEQPANSVAHELQRGYRRSDRLVRPAMVVVSTGPAPTVADGDARAQGEDDGDAPPAAEEEDGEGAVEPEQGER